MNVLKLDPEAVTTEALEWVAAMAERSGWELPELPRTEQAPQSAELRFRIHALCAYAQEGKRVDGPPGPHIAAVTEALYAPAYPHAPQYRHALDAEPPTAVDALLRASLARERVEAGRPTPAGWLAVLAGVDLLQLPASYRNGDVPAKVALRLLSGRVTRRRTAVQPESRKTLPPYLTATEVARSLGWTRRRVARWLQRAGVTTVPPGRCNSLVSTELLRKHLPDLYEIVRRK